MIHKLGIVPKLAPSWKTLRCGRSLSIYWKNRLGGVSCSSWVAINKQLQDRYALTTKILFNFCNQSRQPKPSHLQKIFNYMTQLKEQEITEKQLELVAQQVLTSSLSKSQKSSVTKYLMSILFKSNFPTNQLLTNQAIRSLQNGQPFIELQTILHVISKQLGKNDPNLKFVNDLYLQCFERVLAGVQDGGEKNKCQAVLLKNFGKYMIRCGMKEKGMGALERSVAMHRQLLLQEHQKMSQSTNQKLQYSDNKQQNRTLSEQQQLTINAKRQNIRRLMQSMFEILHFYSHQKMTEITSQSTPQQKQDSAVLICALIGPAIKMKALLPGVQIYSKYYHKLMLIYYQLEYGYAMMKKDKEKTENMLRFMKEFERECLGDIVLAKEMPEMQKEIAVVIFGIQLHLSRARRGTDVGAIKKDLSEVGFDIVGKEEVKEKEEFTRLLADFMKKNRLQNFK